eukprot:g15526.t1
MLAICTPIVSSYRGALPESIYPKVQPVCQSLHPHCAGELLDNPGAKEAVCAAFWVAVCVRHRWSGDRGRNVQLWVRLGAC